MPLRSGQETQFSDQDDLSGVEQDRGCRHDWLPLSPVNQNHVIKYRVLFGCSEHSENLRSNALNYRFNNFAFEIALKAIIRISQALSSIEVNLYSVPLCHYWVEIHPID